MTMSSSSTGQSGQDMRQSDIELWRAADALFNDLLDVDAGQRASTLAAMDLDPALRSRVQRLLDADADEKSPLGDSNPLAPSAAIAGRHIGRWVVEREIGRGGMAVVYLAHAVDSPDRAAAIKLLTLGALAGPGAERFRREQAILARLNHPHIATLLDTGIEADGTPWIAMTLVDGERIDNWCNSHALDARARIGLFLDVCAAVTYAHHNLVVHRDLKPSNVLVDQGGHVRLLDFGIARLTDDTLGEATATHWRALSPMYAAPEQFSGSVASTAMDVYGLGALLHTLLTGGPPQGVASADQAIQPPSLAARCDPQAAAARLPSASTVRGDLDAIVLKALAYAPGARYSSVEALADDLRRWREGRPVRARPATVLNRALRVLRRHWLPASLAAVAIFALVLGTVVSLNRAAEAQAQALRATQAQVETQLALDRANALREFLIGLFEVQAPGRPRDELPSTAQLLEEGENLALNAEARDTSVRADMLDAITQVWLARNQLPRASKLIDETMDLARSVPGGAPWIHARALMRRSYAQRLRGDQHGGMQSLDEAKALLAGEPASTLTLEIDVARASTLSEMHRFADAVAIVEPLLQTAELDPQLRPLQRQGLYSAAAIALGGAGQHVRSVQYRERSLENLRLRFGARHFRTAVATANLGNGLWRLGNFSDGESRLHQALSIYDAVLDQPSEYRGSARVALGLLYQAAGRFDDAIAALDQGNTEFALSRGITVVDDYDFYHYNRGIVMALSMRWRDAIDALQSAQAGLSSRPAGFSLSRATAAAWQAHAYCALGDTQAAAPLLQVMAAQSAAVDEIPADDHSTFDESRAACALAAGQVTSARQSAEQMLARDVQLKAGFAADVARRRLLAARIEHGARAIPAAMAHLAAARAALHGASLDRHPLHARIDEFERVLTGSAPTAATPAAASGSS